LGNLSVKGQLALDSIPELSAVADDPRFCLASLARYESASGQALSLDKLNRLRRNWNFPSILFNTLQVYNPVPDCERQNIQPQKVVEAKDFSIIGVKPFCLAYAPQSEFPLYYAKCGCIGSGRTIEKAGGCSVLSAVKSGY
jgi:hypothetical protein